MYKFHNSPQNNSLAELSGNYNGYIQLESGDDLNDKTSVGWYVCRNSSTARDIENNPLGSLAFLMHVFNSINANSVIQVVYSYNVGASTTALIYIRYYYSGSGGSWGDWKSFAFN